MMRWGTVARWTIALLVVAGLGLPATAQQAQVLRFGAYVHPIVHWVGEPQTAGALSAAPPLSRAEGDNAISTIFRLALNVDVTLVAQVRPFTNPNDPTDRLETLWRITDDGNGNPSATGVRARHAKAVEGYQTFVSMRDFIPRGLRVTHRPGDGNVRIVITAKAALDALEGGFRVDEEGQPTVPDAGTPYVASIMLTALPDVTGMPRNVVTPPREEDEDSSTVRYGDRFRRRDRPRLRPRSPRERTLVREGLPTPPPPVVAETP